MAAQPTPLYPSSQHSAGILPAGPIRVTGLRVGDTDRNRACDALALHFAEGRLSPDELDARLAAATAAVTQTDLSGLLSDLPRTDGYRPQRARHPQHPQQVGLRTARTSPVLDALVWVGVIGAFGLIMLMMVGMGMVSPALFLAAAFGGMVATLFGGGVVHLMHRSIQRRQPPAG